MDEGAEQRRVELRLLPGKRPQAVLQEEGVAAAGEAVELRGGQGERLSIERLHGGGGHIRKMIAAARREAFSLGPDGVREPGRQRGLAQGGAGGGGSTLTPEGRSLLERYRQWEADCKAYAKAHLADFFPEAAE